MTQCYQTQWREGSQSGQGLSSLVDLVVVRVLGWMQGYVGDASMRANCFLPRQLVAGNNSNSMAASMGGWSAWMASFDVLHT